MQLQSADHMGPSEVVIVFRSSEAVDHKVVPSLTAVVSSGVHRESLQHPALAGDTLLVT